MKLEVGKTYSCRNSRFFGEVCSTLSGNSNYAFVVKFYRLGGVKLFKIDTVTKEGRRFCECEDYLDLMKPLDEDFLGELK